MASGISDVTQRAATAIRAGMATASSPDAEPGLGALALADPGDPAAWPTVPDSTSAAMDPMALPGMSGGGSGAGGNNNNSDNVRAEKAAACVRAWRAKTAQNAAQRDRLRHEFAAKKERHAAATVAGAGGAGAAGRVVDPRTLARAARAGLPGAGARPGALGNTTAFSSSSSSSYSSGSSSDGGGGGGGTHVRPAKRAVRRRRYRRMTTAPAGAGAAGAAAGAAATAAGGAAMPTSLRARLKQKVQRRLVKRSAAGAGGGAAAAAYVAAGGGDDDDDDGDGGGDDDDDDEMVYEPRHEDSPSTSSASESDEDQQFTKRERKQLKHLRRAPRLDVNDCGLELCAPALFEIPKLRALSLANNDLAWLPGQIARLKRLEYLDVSENILPVLPAELNKLRRLKVLVAKNINRHPECLSASVGTVVLPPNLVSLELTGAALSDVPNFKDCAHTLHTLTLSAPRVDGSTMLSQVDILTNLIVLRCPNAGLTHLPESVTALRNLQELDVSHNKLKALSESVTSMTQLERLHFESNPDLVSCPRSMNELKRLTALSCDMHTVRYLGSPSNMRYDPYSGMSYQERQRAMRRDGQRGGRGTAYQSGNLMPLAVCSRTDIVFAPDVPMTPSGLHRVAEVEAQSDLAPEDWPYARSIALFCAKHVARERHSHQTLVSRRAALVFCAEFLEKRADERSRRGLGTGASLGSLNADIMQHWLCRRMDRIDVNDEAYFGRRETDDAVARAQSAYIDDLGSALTEDYEIF